MACPTEHRDIWTLSNGFTSVLHRLVCLVSHRLASINAALTQAMNAAMNLQRSQLSSHGPRQLQPRIGVSSTRQAQCLHKLSALGLQISTQRD